MELIWMDICSSVRQKIVNDNWWMGFRWTGICSSVHHKYDELNIPLAGKLPKNKELYLLCFLLVSELRTVLAHSSHSISIHWVELRKEYSDHFKEWSATACFVLSLVNIDIRMEDFLKMTFDEWHSSTHGRPALWPWILTYHMENKCVALGCQWHSSYLPTGYSGWPKS